MGIFLPSNRSRQNRRARSPHFRVILESGLYYAFDVRRKRWNEVLTAYSIELPLSIIVTQMIGYRYRGLLE